MAALSASKFRRGAARQSAATSMAGFHMNCSSAAVQLQKSRVRACDLILTYHTGRAALSCCRPPISEGHPISRICSRSGVRLYAANPRSGPSLLCAAARFVSAMYATVWVLPDLPSSRTSLCWKGWSSQLLRVLQQKGIYTYLVRIPILFLIFRFDEIYVRLHFFTLGRSFYA